MTERERFAKKWAAILECLEQADLACNPTEEMRAYRDALKIIKSSRPMLRTFVLLCSEMLR